MFDQALPHIQQSVKMNPYSANVNDLGVVYQHKGDIQKAKKYYTQAINLKPALLSPYINLATILVLYDDPKEAIPLIKNQLIKSHSDVSRFWVLLAVAEYKSHNQDAALQATQTAYNLSADPQTAYVYDIISNRKPIESIDNKLLE
jgi:predicted Zn-dependent protease